MGIVCTSQNDTVNSYSNEENNMELYYIPMSPPSRAVLLTLRALDLKPKMRQLDMFQKAEHKQAWYLKINPTHTVPTLTDNDFNLWESRAIMAYLVNKYAKDDKLYPKDPQQRAMVDRMLYFDVGTLYKSISEYWKWRKIMRGEGKLGVIAASFDSWIKNSQPQLYSNQPPDSQKANLLKQSLEYLDRFLQDRNYVATDYVTIADFSILASVTALECYKYDYSVYNNVQLWVDSLKNEIPYYDECIQKGIDETIPLVETLLHSK